MSGEWGGAGFEFVVEPGKDVYDVEGERLGSVRDIFGDSSNMTARWAVVSMEAQYHVVPLFKAQPHEGDLQIDWARDVVSGSPILDAEFGDDVEERLEEYYGI